ncbi:Bcr/CflA family efflux MFS transporter [Agromyces sp. Marseille-P2726]|uniref:Bcr/CflA family efflux MFS transporter n=1 Tax=Agromyces sp. Marseille-P2726 TaxID=2709132 RepID=UPI0015708B6C|nr:Bcr/CflA family efflux MFS transporter [Agromyces sp. Marseille-P2726]
MVYTRRVAGTGVPPELNGTLLVVLCAIMILNPIVANMYLPALGIMADDLGTTIAGIQVALTAFLLGVAVGQLMVGALSDALGRRRVIIIGFAVLTAAGVLVAAAPNLDLLILGRVFQGLGASAGVVVIRAVIADIGVRAQVPRAYSLLTGTLAIGPLVASFLGTVLLEVGGWRLILVGITVISALFLLLVAWRMPETLALDRRATLHPASMAATYGRLLKDPAYVGNALTMALALGGIMAHVSASSFVAQDVLGADVWGFWAMFTVYALSVLVGGMANAPLSARFGAQRMQAIALTVAIASTAALTVITATGLLTVASYLPLIALACGSATAIMANATTLTLARAGFAAASGAALMGSIQFAAGAAASPIGGLWGPHTAVPMAAAMFGCFLLSLAARAFARYWERRMPVPAR